MRTPLERIERASGALSNARPTVYRLCVRLREVGVRARYLYVESPAR